MQTLVRLVILTYRCIKIKLNVMEKYFLEFNKKSKLSYILDSLQTKWNISRVFCFNSTNPVSQKIRTETEMFKISKVQLCTQYLVGAPLAQINVGWNGGDQPVALLRRYWNPGCFDRGLQLVYIVRKSRIRILGELHKEWTKAGVTTHTGLKETSEPETA